MSFGLNNRKPQGSANRGRYGEDKTYKRDTIAAIIVMAVIFISPIAIMATTNYGRSDADIYESRMNDYAELLASPSTATASDAEETEEDQDTQAAEETEAAGESDVADETAEESDAE